MSGKLKICITGGSGFIGTNAINFLSQQGFEICNIDINPPKEIDHHRYWRCLDIRDQDIFQNVIEEFAPDYILHLAATTGMDAPDLNYFSTNTVGVSNLINIAKNLPYVKRVLFTSSLLVCKNGYVPTNDDDYCPPNFYGESKKIGEELVKATADWDRWVIVRPTSIWGPWFEHSYRAFFRMIDLGIYFHPGSRDIKKPLSYVENTVYMMTRLLISSNIDERKINKKTFYLADYPEISIQEWANFISASLRGRDCRTLPVFLYKIIAWIGDFFKYIGFLNFPITSFRLNNMLTGSHYPIEMTENVVGPLPFNFKDGVLNTLKWMYFKKQISNNPKCYEL